MQILLETERLRLRRFSTDDAQNLYELDADPAVMRYLTGGAQTPRAVIDTEIVPRFASYDPDAPAFGFWAAEERISSRFIGWFSLRPAAQNASDGVEVAALGYRLFRAFWGRGYGTEGVHALINLAFRDLGIVRVVATTYEENIASQRVMEKAGMQLVRRFRITPAELASIDTYHADTAEIWDGDDLEFAITRKEWLEATR